MAKKLLRKRKSGGQYSEEQIETMSYLCYLQHRGNEQLFDITYKKLADKQGVSLIYAKKIVKFWKDEGVLCISKAKKKFTNYICNYYIVDYHKLIDGFCYKNTAIKRFKLGEKLGIQNYTQLDIQNYTQFRGSSVVNPSVPHSLRYLNRYKKEKEKSETSELRDPKRIPLPKRAKNSFESSPLRPEQLSLLKKIEEEERVFRSNMKERMNNPLSFEVASSSESKQIEKVEQEPLLRCSNQTNSYVIDETDVSPNPNLLSQEHEKHTNDENTLQLEEQGVPAAQPEVTDEIMLSIFGSNYCAGLKSYNKTKQQVTVVFNKEITDGPIE